MNHDAAAAPSTPAPLSWTPPQELVDDLMSVLAAAPRQTPQERFEAAAWSALVRADGPVLLTRAHLVGHVTASAIVLSADGTQTCLVLHGRMGRWVQPGGHLEPGDVTVAGAAAREVWEETGLRGTVLPSIELSRHLAPCRPEVDHHLDVRFVLVAEPTPPTVSAESRDVRWWPVAEPVPDAVEDLPQSLAFATRAYALWASGAAGA
ncbi:MAG: NUDIX domain-containing protein [Kineosporiaceae bacterium]